MASILSIGERLIDRLLPDPKQAQEAKQSLHQMEHTGELTAMVSRYSAINTEASSKDPWVSRARPTFLYVFYLILLMQFFVVPTVGIFFPAQVALFYTNLKEGLEAIPEPLWWLFGSGFLGYGAYRTVDKVKGGSK